MPDMYILRILIFVSSLARESINFIDRVRVISYFNRKSLQIVIGQVRNRYFFEPIFRLTAKLVN